MVVAIVVDYSLYQDFRMYLLMFKYCFAYDKWRTGDSLSVFPHLLLSHRMMFSEKPVKPLLFYVKAYCLSLSW